MLGFKKMKSLHIFMAGLFLILPDGELEWLPFTVGLA